MDKELSIITVTYNCEKTLQRTIDSVLNQDFDKYEYLIIDGGSTDSTLDIIEKNIGKFNGKLTYISEKDNGLYDAMNKGIRLARGKYIGIINGDDYYNSNIFKHVIEYFDDECVDIVYSDLIFTKFGKEQENKPLVGSHINLKYRMSVNHPTCFVRKSVYEKYGLFNLKYKIAADYEIMTRFFINDCKFKKSDKVIAFMELGGLSSNNQKSIYEKLEIHRMYFGKIHSYKQFIKNKLIYLYRKKIKKYGA